MIRPVGDAGTVNYFANHPEIRPFIGGEGELDLSIIVTAPNVALFGEHGGFCLSWTAPGTWEVHTMIVKAGRGRWALEAAEKSLEYMKGIGAFHLWTRVHPDMRNVERFTRMMGFRPCGTLETDFGQGPIDYNLFNWRA